MKTDAQRDAELAHVSDMIEALLRAHNMCIMAEDIATDILLRHTQLVDGKINARLLKLELLPF